jgi:hypothetical protein
MRFHLFIALMIAAVLPRSSNSATVEIAVDEYQKPLRGVTVEGDIEPGDSTKLLSRLVEYGFIYNPDVARVVFLRSKGGNIAEAMAMGALIRRLRLATDAPTKFGGHPETFCTVTLSDKSDCVCASACFLAFAGGVDRTGTLLALHRPYIPKEAAGTLSDVEFEAIEKAAIVKTVQYLKSMEVDQFFIDKMVSSNSRNVYVVTVSEAIEHHLVTLVPSIEEFVLSKCQAFDLHDQSVLQATDDKTIAGQQSRAQLIAKLRDSFECKDRVLTEMRRSALQRELDNIRR